ncbi:chaoptin [Culicoides brevitarsis]|uniref:chaoptin n=1 Tax=Culicoides brevitarsis TaxID=469753 RepID=UPI00307BECF6
MHFHHKIIGFSLFYLIVVSRLARTADSDVLNEYGEYEDEEEELQTTNDDYRQVEPTFVETPHKRKPEMPSSGDISCPTECFCTQNSHFFVNCSNRDLTQIPKNLPKIVYEIDLSYNNITTLDVDSFVSLSRLYKINLANNQIEDVERLAFRDLENLRIIDLTNNTLTQIQPETFNEARKLEQLWLAGNPIEMPNIGPFLDQKGLKLLDLENCNLTNSDLQAELFKPLVVLKSLNLMNNFFEGNINTKTFAPLENLAKLRIPEVSEWSIKELCVYLKAIDVIEVAGKYMISCYELSVGLSFEESIIQTSTHSTIVRHYDDDMGINDVLTDDDEPEVQQKDTPSNDSRPQMNDTDIQNKVITTRENGLGTQEQHVDTENDTNDQDVTERKTFGERFNLADIPQEVINQILIGLILLILLSIIISIVFRRDCCGIKTKLCRTRRPRHPTDQVRPIPEEVPLNKITTST